MHEILLKTERNGIIDTCFYGSVYFADKNNIYEAHGEDTNKICFIRSLAKPLQTSILFDFDIVKNLKIKQSELAIFSGSHAGSPLHINKLKEIHKKYNLNVADLLLETAEPLDKRKFKGPKTKLHNNCSGKHTMMLLASKYLELDKNYTKPDGKLQKIIKNKQDELSNYKSELISYDGCGTPLWGLPYKNIIKAYYSLCENHSELIKAIINNSYIYGGFNRLDSEIIKSSKGKLFSKVGATGFVIVYNIDTKEIILLKMAQDNNEARRLITLNILNNLNWIDYEVDDNIYNQKKQIVAKYKYTLRK